MGHMLALEIPQAIAGRQVIETTCSIFFISSGFRYAAVEGQVMIYSHGGLAAGLSLLAR